MITTQQIQKPVNSISEVAVSEDRMSITVVCRDLTGFEHTGAGNPRGKDTPMTKTASGMEDSQAFGATN